MRHALRVADDGAVRQRALARVMADGIEPILAVAGFARQGRRLSWLRRTPQLSHVVSLDGRRGSYVTQWGVGCDQAAAVLWDTEADATDVRWAVMTGSPSGIRHPSPGGSFTPADEASAEQARAVAEAMTLIEEYLRPFQTRRDLRLYLLANRHPKDRRGFVVPANLPLKLLVAATLAVLDDDLSAATLIAEAEAALAPFRDSLSPGRVARLKALAAANFK
jgi:hypothetical protein